MGRKQITEQEYKCDRAMCSLVERFKSHNGAEKSGWRLWRTYRLEQGEYDEFVLCPAHTKEVWELLTTGNI